MRTKKHSLMEEIEKKTGLLEEILQKEFGLEGSSFTSTLKQKKELNRSTLRSIKYQLLLKTDEGRTLDFFIKHYFGKFHQDFEGNFVHPELYPKKEGRAYFAEAEIQRLLFAFGGYVPNVYAWWNFQVEQTQRNGLDIPKEASNMVLLTEWIGPSIEEHLKKLWLKTRPPTKKEERTTKEEYYDKAGDLLRRTIDALFVNDRLSEHLKLDAGSYSATDYLLRLAERNYGTLIEFWFAKKPDEKDDWKYKFQNKLHLIFDEIAHLLYASAQKTKTRVNLGSYIYHALLKHDAIEEEKKYKQTHTIDIAKEMDGAFSHLNAAKQEFYKIITGLENIMKIDDLFIEPSLQLNPHNISEVLEERIRLKREATTEQKDIDRCAAVLEQLHEKKRSVIDNFRKVTEVIQTEVKKYISRRKEVADSLEGFYFVDPRTRIESKELEIATFLNSICPEVPKEKIIQLAIHSFYTMFRLKYMKDEQEWSENEKREAHETIVPYFNNLLHAHAYVTLRRVYRHIVDGTTRQQSREDIIHHIRSELSKMLMYDNLRINQELRDKISSEEFKVLRKGVAKLDLFYKAFNTLTSNEKYSPL